jgi:antitoxin ParD1/3/4
MNVGPIPPELQQFVDQELASGRYKAAEEVICAGLRLLREQKLYELRGEIQRGLDQLDRGEGIELEDESALRGFFEDIKTRGRQRLEAEQAGQ